MSNKNALEALQAAGVAASTQDRANEALASALSVTKFTDAELSFIMRLASWVQDWGRESIEVAHLNALKKMIKARDQGITAQLQIILDFEKAEHHDLVPERATLVRRMTLDTAG